MFSETYISKLVKVSTEPRIIEALNIFYNIKDSLNLPPMRVEDKLKLVLKGDGQQDLYIDYVRNTIQIICHCGLMDPKIENILRLTESFDLNET